jgi:hypothetical protein
MLIEKAISVQEVIAAKLITGEEVIARILEINADHFVLTLPMTLVMMQAQNGQGVIGMAPFMVGPAEGTKLKIEYSKIVAYAKARSDAAGQYIQATSKIAVPQPGAGLAGLSGLRGPLG